MTWPDFFERHTFLYAFTVLMLFVSVAELAKGMKGSDK